MAKKITSLFLIFVIIASYLPRGDFFVGKAMAADAQFSGNLGGPATFFRPVFPHEADWDTGPDGGAYGSDIDNYTGVYGPSELQEQDTYQRGLLGGFNYLTKYIKPTADGEYSIETLSSSSVSSADTVLFLYESPFDPNQPLKNLLKANDDNKDGFDSYSKIPNIQLSSSKEYVIVVTGYDPNDTGLVNFSVTGVGSVTSSDTPIPNDITPPTAGNAGIITAGNLSITSATLNWIKATDDITAPGNLEYKVYQSTSSNINTLSDVKANGTILGVAAKDINSINVSGLNPNTTYYFNIIVKDEAGNESIYNMLSVTTAAPNNPPTASDNIINENEGEVKALKASDFSFSDQDNDSLDHITITKAPIYGNLFVDADGDGRVDSGEELVDGTTVSAAALNANQLKYSATGQSASFQFTVNDGKADSIAPNTITLKVNAMPTITVSSTELSPTNANPFKVAVKFSEPVIGFSEADLVVSNGTVVAGSLTGSGDSYEVEITPQMDGNVKVNIPAGAVVDDKGLTNKAAAEYSQIFDGTAPTATIIYDVTFPTSGNVTATLKPSEPVTVTNNDGNNSYVFTDNGSFTFQFTDAAGNPGSANATVANIDKNSPIVIGVANGGLYNTEKTISFNEGTATLNGVPFSSDGKVSEDQDYTLVVTDDAGNTTTVNFTIDQTAPVLSHVAIYSNHGDSELAAIGDTITVEFQSNEEIQVTQVTIAGHTASVVQNGDAKHWKATYVMQNGDTDGDVPFALYYQDLAGNPGTDATSTTDGSKVTFDGTIPTATAVTMSSDNVHPSIAKVGDEVTLDFVTSEPVSTPTVKILGNPATVTQDGDATKWTATYTLQSSDTEGTVAFTLDFKDLTGNAGTQVTDLTSGQAVYFDKTAPTAEITMSSSNSNPAYGKVGNTISLTISANEEIQTPTVTIAGHSVIASDGGDSDTKTWIASYTMKASDAEGAVAFTLDMKDKAGNDAAQVTSVTSGSVVIFDQTAPTLTQAAISSNHGTPEFAAIGDTITLEFQSDEALQTPTVTIAGHTAGVVQNGDAKHWTATYVMQSTDTDGDVPFAVYYKDLAGNPGTDAASSTDGSKVIFDGTAPTVETIMMSSNNPDPSIAKVGDVITLDFTTSEPVASPTVKILGKPAAVTQNGDAANWKAAYTLQEGDTEGAVNFTIDFEDLTGNKGTQAAHEDSPVVFDKTIPGAAVAMSSSNSNPAFAKVGDSVTLTIVATEEVQTPVVTIAGHSIIANDGDDSDPKTWKASYTMRASDTEGNVAFTLDFKDKAGNEAIQVTDVTSGSAVMFDQKAPTLSLLTISSSNTNPAKAKVGDAVTLMISADEAIKKSVVTISGNAAEVTQTVDAAHWQATYTIQSGDEEGDIPFTVNYEDLAGNAGVEAADSTDGNAVLFDGTPPTAEATLMSSTNPDQRLAKAGDVISIDFTTSEPVLAPTVKVLGKSAAVTQGEDATKWKAAYTLQSGDSEGPVTFTFDFNDLAGNVGTQVTELKTGTPVIFDKMAPAIVHTSPAHEQEGIEFSSDLSLTFSEDIQFGTGAIRVKKVSDDSVAATINAADATAAGHDVTLHTGVVLDSDTEYYVLIDEAAFLDLAGNQFSGIADKSTWTFKTRPLSVEATLNSLAIDRGTLYPAFSSEETEYRASVPNSVNSIRVTPTVADHNATLALNGKSATSGEISEPIPLVVGKNTISVIVTAEDGVATKTYTLTIYRSFPPSTTEIITVDVENNSKGTTVSKTTIERTKETDGTVKDKVTLTPESAKETIDKLAAAGDNTARIVIPDKNDVVKETNISLPKQSVDYLKKAKTNLVIQTSNAGLSIPYSSLAKFMDDLYFRIVPVKEASEKEKIKERAKKEELIRKIAGGHEIQVIGRPAEIETNMQSQPVTVALPLRGADLPKDQSSRQDLLKNLVVFIEHSDGTKELKRGKVIVNEDSSIDYEFGVDKFSTFTMVYLDGADHYFTNLEKQQHKGYILGYKDGTFRPNSFVTRSQMAAMLARNLGLENTNGEAGKFFNDVPSDYWAAREIALVKEKGIMTGHADGAFGPQDTITRAQMAAIAYRWVSKKCSEDAASYSFCGELGNERIPYHDVPKGYWAEEAILSLRNTKIMEGMADGSFHPNEKLTRAQAVKVLNRLFGRGPLYGEFAPTFSDVSEDFWAYREIEEAVRDHFYIIEDGKEVYRDRGTVQGSSSHD
ncbi:S-layer homology domain-containing protein [Falsibacillus pallidus]|uniref:S-layer homology domain-containing protein n=1 Tax=Falsibacillus pallidus TaxID=493781 RepID=UPI003D974BC7